MFNQAKKIIDAFGGASTLARHLNLPKATVYKWNYPKEKNGTDGLIPSHRVADIIKLGTELEIELDWTCEQS